jgi:hypothetical protein
MIKSKFTTMTWPFVIILTMLPLHLFYTTCKIVVDNVSTLTDLVVVAQVVVLILTILFLLMMLERHTRGFVIQDDKLEVKYFLGLSTKSYDFRVLKFAYYNWTTKLALLELPNGGQLTLSESQYRNYEEIAQTLKTRIQNEQLKFKFINRLTVFVAIAMVLLFLTVFALGQG